MLLQNENYAFSLLDGNILIGASSLDVTAGDGSLFPSTGFFMAAIYGSAYASPALDPLREIVKATFVSGDTFTITRAQEGTVAKAWSNADNFALVLTAGKMDELEDEVQKGVIAYGAATGTDTYAAVLDPALTSLETGTEIKLKFNNLSTGAVTLNVNALGAKKIYGKNGSSYEHLGAGDIKAAQYTHMLYDASLDGAAGGWVLTDLDKALGLVADLAKTAMSGSGDLLYTSAANTLARLAKGSANEVLRMNAAGTFPEWGSTFSSVSFTRDTSTATGTQAITGAGFKPRGVIILGGIEYTTQVSWGAAVSGYVAFSMSDYSGGGGGYRVLGNAVYIWQSGAIAYSGDISSWDADGITIQWNKIGAKTGTATFKAIFLA
ncbi:MAG: hypothetical protein GY861_16770 [bacterium]|nr:hypothetical protein [bacterium]